MDETSGPQTRAKTAAARHDGNNMELSEAVAKSPRKVVGDTAKNKTDATDGGNSAPRTITSFYSLRSGTKSAGVFYHVQYVIWRISVDYS